MLFLELLRGEYLAKRESVILLGSPGTGKTHLATVLATTARRHGKRVRFWRVTELVTTLLEAREERTLLRVKGQLAKLDLLVLDEFGYVPYPAAARCHIRPTITCSAHLEEADREPGQCACCADSEVAG